MWKWVVTWFGGFYGAGPVNVVIHDNGVFLAWRQVIQWEWRR